MKKIKFVITLALIWLLCQPSRLLCCYGTHFLTSIIVAEQQKIIQEAQKIYEQMQPFGSNGILPTKPLVKP